MPPTPEFILSLREQIGTELLWLPGGTAYVLREEVGRTQVLLVRRADNGRWTPPTGIGEPGEEPDLTAAREVLEETCVRVEVERLLWVTALIPITYPNGDRAQYLDLAFRCRYLDGEARVGDDESVDVRWFDVDDVPPLQPRFTRQLACALGPDGPVRFGGQERLR